jgi:seryl-tRNA synthetase
MLQVAAIREDVDKVIQGLKKRNIKDVESLITSILSLDDQRKQTQKSLDDDKAKVNANSKLIGELLKKGNTEDANKIKDTIGALKSFVNTAESDLVRFETELKELLYKIPNVPNENVPAGFGADDNKVVFATESLPQLQEGALPHWELIKKYDIIDFDLGTKIAGAGFPVYKDKGAKLQRAMINFFLQEAENAGYGEIQPPIVVNEASGYGTGQLPDKEGQMYHASADNLYLIPTAEVPITNLYRDVILSDEDLPVKNAGYTPCFRREAGSWGAHVRGLNRLHQFDKVEVVQIHKPENSYAALEEMCNHVEGLLKKLELPYRKLLLCGGDMGFTSAMTYDFEVYSAAQQRWLEVSSVSNFETFQANRLKLRHKSKEGKIQLLHTLNGSALALPRIVAAILENNQTAQGIVVPRALRSFLNFEVIN